MFQLPQLKKLEDPIMNSARGLPLSPSLWFQYWFDPPPGFAQATPVLSPPCSVNRVKYCSYPALSAWRPIRRDTDTVPLVVWVIKLSNSLPPTCVYLL